MSRECVAGLDIGSRMTKGVLMDEGRHILARIHFPTGTDLAASSAEAMRRLLKNTNLSQEDIGYVAATGYGRFQAKMRDIAITDLTCHARGALEAFPQTRCVLDIGAQSTRAMRVESNGRVSAFRMNDKCAAGAGRFVERIARSLDVPLAEVGPRSLEAREPVEISSVCAVLAESEVINHVTAGGSVEDILAGAHKSIADRVAGLLKQIGAKPEITLTGGMSRNAGMLAALEQVFGCRINVHPDAEYSGALGAALWALTRLQKKAA